MNDRMSAYELNSTYYTNVLKQHTIINESDTKHYF